MMRDRRKNIPWLDLTIGILVLLIIVVHPTSWAFSLGWLGRLLGFGEQVVKKAPHFALADILIWLAGALLLVRIVLLRDWRAFRLLPIASVVLSALAVLSMLYAQNKLTALADVIQFITYFIVLYLLFVNVLSTKDRLQLAMQLWLAVGSIVAVWAMIHYLDVGRDAIEVSGPFANRNILSGYLAMLIPITWGLMLTSRSPWTVAQSLVLAGLGFVVMLSGGPWLAAAAGILVVTTVRAPKLVPVLLAGLLLTVLVVFPFCRRDNAHVLAKSVYTYNETRTIEDETERTSQRYLRWQASLKFLTPTYFTQDGRAYHTELPTVSRAKHTRQLLLGVGIGNYESSIERFHGRMPKPNRNTVEPDTSNLYLVLAVTVGLPALAVFVWLLAGFFRRAAMGCRCARDPFLRGLLLGCIGALTSLAIVNVFTETLIRGSGPAMILIFALIASGTRLAERKPTVAE